MADRPKLLWVSDAAAPANVVAASQERWELLACDVRQPLGAQLQRVSLVVICPNGRVQDTQWFREVLAALNGSRTVAVFLLPPGQGQQARQLLAGQRGRCLCLDAGASAEQLRASFTAAAALQPLVEELQDELSAARQLSDGAARTVEEIDEQMRLAARVQRDFLPRRLPEIGPVRFGVLFRPASWVSGDIYDIIRLDETHIGFYVVDATGHGMPAALMTMFIKRALQTKRIIGNTYQIVPPEVSMAELNTDICEQNLSSCQFCTAVYGVLDTTSLELNYARGGHPEPLLFHADGSVERLRADGVLLGAYANAQFQSRQVRLRRGDRLLLYTDGIEEPLRAAADQPGQPLDKIITRWASMPRDQMLLQMASRIDALSEHGNPRLRDDVTVLLVDIE